MNKWWILALVFSWVGCLGTGYEAGIWHAAADQDKTDKKEIIAVHDDVARGEGIAAGYEKKHAANEAKIDSLNLTKEAGHAKTVAPACRVSNGIMQSIGEAVKSRTAR